MDAKLGYWCFALVLMSAAVAVGIRGRHLARGGDHAGHRRLMSIAGLLIVGFLVSYPLKLAILGREDISSWSRAEVAMLRLHETVITLMLVTGIAAFRLMRREKGVPASRSRVAHRNLGRAAVVAGVLGLLTAGGLFGSMVNARRLETVTRLEAAKLGR